MVQELFLQYQDPRAEGILLIFLFFFIRLRIVARLLINSACNKEVNGIKNLVNYVLAILTFQLTCSMGLPIEPRGT